ncbi:pantoate--beta-alanine ligase [Shewanella woodyi]|uniref:Pantothenate synthetase n=1 Tax=Shewanella woodyi (strain ATCC 51908 / MS32) TaxID=392500 RepID=PANC_SHEWM|nr:pantoate--beta-alanine ligase [Shewanella woodyi]B1KEP7.1 RecName: Full=Pantothenate synthetase; Short=PS; AltName: Full=Pantoate--beta-alanine ligase; AltName: Full=Pantoate-activating enzyme [Shewanella woodyi ATCC 51908]ACA88062.1 pantoate--beta-alanine ligase [Shewanella woodyi ATCC 51908]
MITTQEIQQIREQIRTWRTKGETIAFVPTMGNLHLGHITLIKEAAKRADHVVASIFVNPMQFGANEDLDAYPRTLEADKLALSDAGAELLFTPTPDIIYPKGMEQQTYVEVPKIGDQLCGASRPGHFRGVATVVCKLFNIVQPDIALFGRKDFQQLMIIKTMVEDLSLPIEIVGIDTIRETSGLAMSSRNGYLSTAQKSQAAVLKQTMDQISSAVKQGASLDLAIENGKQALIDSGFTPDYLELRNAKDLSLVTDGQDELVILAAAYMGNTRLIDNLCFTR